MLTLDPFEAARVAGYQNPLKAGPKLLANPQVQNALRQARAFRSSRTAIAVDHVLRRWWQLATADVNELMELRIVACRYCHGLDHRYQYRDNELRELEARHLREMNTLPENQRVPFDDLGGGGYSTKLVPDPDCPACSGEGIPHGVIKDTRYLSPAGRILYNGFEVKKGGMIKINIRDRGFAEQMVAKHLGMFNERKPIEVFDPARMTEDQLQAVMDALPPEVLKQIEVMVEGGAPASAGSGESEGGGVIISNADPNE